MLSCPATGMALKETILGVEEFIILKIFCLGKLPILDR
jgi:hypothetical protein